MSTLKYYSKDPNKKGRGRGFYYNRTWAEQGYGSKYMSKYNADRDYAIGKKTGGNRYKAHTTDDVKKAGDEIPTNRKRFLSETGKLYGGGTSKTKKYKMAHSKKKYSSKKTTKRNNRYK